MKMITAGFGVAVFKTSTGYGMRQNGYESEITESHARSLTLEIAGTETASKWFKTRDFTPDGTGAYVLR